MFIHVLICILFVDTVHQISAAPVVEGQKIYLKPFYNKNDELIIKYQLNRNETILLHLNLTTVPFFENQLVAPEELTETSLTTEKSLSFNLIDTSSKFETEISHNKSVDLITDNLSSVEGLKRKSILAGKTFLKCKKNIRDVNLSNFFYSLILCRY